MFDKDYLNKLKQKYNYNQKTINALAKIMPCLITYYGEEHETLILNALFDCEIIPCNSYQTISKINKEKQQTKLVGESPIGDIDLIRGEGSYLSNISIKYNEMSNSYIIDNISRTIATSHTFNYDSPKGLEVLTYALCKLVKSYQNEYQVEENNLIKRSGISTETRRIVNNNEIYLELIKDEGKGLEEGFTIYDTEQIVSLVLTDKYKCYDYDSISTIANILKEKFNLLDEINDFEITGNIDKWKKLIEEGLEIKSDECFLLEHEMFISMFRQEKDELAKKISQTLASDIYSHLIKIYQKKQKDIVKV